MDEGFERTELQRYHEELESIVRYHIEGMIPVPEERWEIFHPFQDYIKHKDRLNKGLDIQEKETQDIISLQQSIDYLRQNDFSPEDKKQMEDIYSESRDLTRLFWIYTNDSIDSRHVDTYQDVLCDEIRLFNMQRSREELIRAVTPSLNRDNLSERKKMLDDIGRRFLFDIHKVYRAWAYSRGMYIKRESFRRR